MTILSTVQKEYERATSQRKRTLSSYINSRRFYQEHLKKSLPDHEKKLTEKRLREYKDLITVQIKETVHVLLKLKAVKNLLLDSNTNELKGVEFFPLTVENNFSLADDILESGDVTSGYCAKHYYNERIDNNFIGTYKIIVNRTKDFMDFIKVLIDDVVIRNINIDFNISFDEWKTGYKVEGKRQSKLNKFLRKKGFSQYTLDFYSQQVKEEKTHYLTISDRVQHIIGMSYFSTGDWSSMNGTSCQDPRNEYEECVRVLASAYDDKLLVAFTHDSIEDIDDMEDMEEKMTARTVCRLIHYKGGQLLIGTRLYGNDENRDCLDNSLKQLNHLGIYANSQHGCGEYHVEDTNGQMVLTRSSYVYIDETIDEYVSCDCPMCDGNGEITRYSTNDNEVTIDCPLCGGRGEYEVNVYEHVEHEEDVEEEDSITPYDEGYIHYGYRMKILIDDSVLQ